MAKTYFRDLTKGPILKQFILFALPIIASNMMQQLYHAADMLVVGNCSQDSTMALAAVGASTNITSTIVSLFVGLSTGVNVICANCIGSKEREGLLRTMQTAIAAFTYGGIIVAVFGVVMARPLLVMMDTPAAVLDEAVKYMQVIFVGKFPALIYNAGAGILRAHGDSKRPMYILLITGLINFILNLVFVIVFRLDAVGVAIATTVANYLSAILVMYVLLKPENGFNLRLRDIRICSKDLLDIVKIGLPSGINSMLFGFSNVVVVSTLNSFGEQAVAGISAANSILNILNTFAGGMGSAFVAFAAQNYGAKNIRRIDTSLWQGILFGDLIYLVIAFVLTAVPEFFVGIFAEDPTVAALGAQKLLTNVWGMLLQLPQNSLNSIQRGIKVTTMPTVISIGFTIVPRVIWIMFVFPHLPRTLISLYLCYPVSWFLATVAQFVSYLLARKKCIRSFKAEDATA